MTEPKDLKIKIGSKLERFWTQVLAQARQQIEETELSTLLQEEVCRIAEEKIRLEHKKQKI